MKKRLILSDINCPVPFPFGPFFIWWLFLDRLSVAGWIWGATGIVLGIWWLLAIIDTFRQEKVSLEEILEKLSDLDYRTKR